MRLYLATANPKKVAELRALLAEADLPVEAYGAEALGGMPWVDEDQDSFSGNAMKKAAALAAQLPPDGWALADDSGLRVDVLGGAPGVRSARFAGDGASDEENVDCLLNALEGRGERERGAAFHCHLALRSSAGESAVFEGVCLGYILEKRRGDAGFGYDPVFVPQGFDRSFAEMSRSEKGAHSHRGAAMRQLVSWLRQRSARAGA